jgi:iron complex outermembrane receptor protein
MRLTRSCRSNPPKPSKLPTARARSAFLLKAMLTGALLSTAPFPQAAWAQGAEAADRKTYSVPAGSLEDALNRFAREAGITLSFDPAQVAGKRAGALQGDYTAQDGLRTLLAPHRLEAVRAADGTYSLQPLPPAAADATTLPVVTVEDEFEREGTSRGYRATHSNATGFGNQPLLDTPHSINVITREVMEEQRVSQLKDVLKNDASVQLDSELRYDNAYIRGFELHREQSYQRDGTRVINLARGGLENVERVEVLKGLTGMYYGMGAPGGNINYVIKRPGPDPLARFWVDANHFGGHRVRADVSQPLTGDGRHGVRFNAAYEDLTNHVRGSGPDHRHFFSAAYLGQLGPSTRLFLDGDYHRLQESLADCYYGLLGAAKAVPPVPDPRRGCAQPWSFFDSKVWNLSARLEHAFTDWLSGQVQILRSQLERSEANPVFGYWAVDANGNGDLFDFTSKNAVYYPTSYRAALNARFDTGPINHDLTGGFMATDYETGFDFGRFEFLGTVNQFQPVPNFPRGTTPYDNTRIKRDRQEQAFYAMDTLSLGEQWKLQVGVRHQELDFDTTWPGHRDQYAASATTPSAALIFKPLPFLSTYVSYIEGLEEGGMVPLAGFTNAGATLPPLESRQIELGAKAELAPGYTVAAALFEIDKGLVLDQSAGGGLLTRTQDGRQVHRGLELSLAGQVMDSLRLTASLMLLDPKMEKTDDPTLKGKRPMNVPKSAVSAYLDWSVPRVEGLGLLAGVFYVGNRAANASNSAVIPGYTRLDLGARYATKVAGKGLVLRAGVDNVTDERYWESSAAEALTVGMERTFRLSAQMDF